MVVLSLIEKYFAFISAKLLGFGNTSAITGKSADLDDYLKLQQHPLATSEKLASQLVVMNIRHVTKQPLV